MKHTLLWRALLPLSELILSSCTIGLGTAVNVVNDRNVFYQVNYTSDYGTVPETAFVPKGKSLTEKELPELEAGGLVFEGWYDGTDSVNPGCTISSDKVLTAHWAIGEEAVFSVK